MAKLKAPLLSFGASGKIAGALVYFPWKGVNAVREYVVPANPRSTAQIAQRTHFDNAVGHWHTNDYTDADRIAWNRFAGTLADIMSGFNAMMRLCIAQLIASQTWPLVSQVEVDTPTVNGFDVDVENSGAGYTLQARIGTSRTHFPTTVALVDDADDTYSLSWAGGQSDTEYYVKLEIQLGGAWYQITGIYHIKTA